MIQPVSQLPTEKKCKLSLQLDRELMAILNLKSTYTDSRLVRQSGAFSVRRSAAGESAPEVRRRPPRAQARPAAPGATGQTGQHPQIYSSLPGLHS